jgi:hypothetical protein
MPACSAPRMFAASIKYNQTDYSTPPGKRKKICLVQVPVVHSTWTWPDNGSVLNWYIESCESVALPVVVFGSESLFSGWRPVECLSDRLYLTGKDAYAIFILF